MLDNFEAIYADVPGETQIVHLSKTIQHYLRKNGSEILLNKTIHNELPTDGAFINVKKGRCFRASKEYDFDIFEIESLDDILDFYIIYLMEDRTCIGRAKFMDLKDLCRIIFDWMENGNEIEQLKAKFKQLEIFEPIKGLTADKSQEWNRIKNFIFSDSLFHLSSATTWMTNYDRMLEKLSRNKFFQKFTPFTSHYRLHLNRKDKDLPWYYIVPTKEGKYIVARQSGIIEEELHEKEFETLDNAIEYYCEILTQLEYEKNKSDFR